MDLIRREMAINTADAMRTRCDGNIDDYHDLMMESLKVLPYVDAVEVVRCGECEHATIWHDKMFLCDIWSDGVFEEGYCNYGERIRNGDETY